MYESIDQRTKPQMECVCVPTDYGSANQTKEDKSH